MQKLKCIYIESTELKILYECEGNRIRRCRTLIEMMQIKSRRIHTNVSEEREGVGSTHKSM